MSFQDIELIKKIKEKDAAALESLVRSYIPRIYNWVRFSVPKSDVDDVVQEVFLAFFSSIYTFKGESSFYTYIYKIAKFKIIDYYRKSRKGGKEPLTEQIEYESSEESPQREILNDEINTLLFPLSEAERQIIMMKFLDEYSFKEISNITGVSYEAVRSKFRRAIGKIHQFKNSHANN